MWAIKKINKFRKYIQRRMSSINIRNKKVKLWIGNRKEPFNFIN